MTSSTLPVMFGPCSFDAPHMMARGQVLVAFVCFGVLCTSEGNSGGSTLTFLPDLILTNSISSNVYLRVDGGSAITTSGAFLRCQLKKKGDGESIRKRGGFHRTLVNETEFERNWTNDSSDDGLSVSSDVGPLGSRSDDDASAWTVVTDRDLHFRDGLTKRVVIKRSEYPSAPTVERLQIECSLNRGRTSSSKIGPGTLGTATAVLVASLQPMTPINWTVAPLTSGRTHDRHYPNPAFNEVASCACDRIPDRCDANCCCDQSCNSVTRDAFVCGAVRVGEDDDLREHDRGHLIAFLQLVESNAPFLGLFYANGASILRSVKAFKNEAVEKMADWPVESTKTEVGFERYSYGSPIVVVVGPDRIAGRLSLPARTLNGKCVHGSPVRFLVPRSSSCVYRVTRSSCVASNLAIGSAAFLASPEFPQIRVLARPAFEQFVNVSVSYSCIGRNGDQSADCEFDVPQYDFDSAVCRNVVASVDYQIFWSDAEVVRIMTTITLTDVPFDDRSTTDVVQLSSVDFVHASPRSGGDGATASFSGNPGYDLNRRLLFGRNGNSSQPNHVNSTDGDALRLLFADARGYCREGSRPIPFRIDQLTGCRLPIFDKVATSCSLLRSYVLGYICGVLDRSAYVSRGGRPDGATLSHFVPIVRSDPCSSLETNGVEQMETEDDWTEDSGVCLHVPSHFSITVLYHDASVDGGHFVDSVRGVEIKTANSTFFRCRNSATRGSFCSDPQSVLLTSSVQFVRLTSRANSSDKRFWLIQNALPCAQDSCWSEIWYPFIIGLDRGWEAIYVAKWTLLLASSSLAVLCLTRGGYW